MDRTKRWLEFAAELSAGALFCILYGACGDDCAPPGSLGPTAGAYGVTVSPLAVANGSRLIVPVISKMRCTDRGPGIIVSSQLSCRAWASAAIRAWIALESRNSTPPRRLVFFVRR
jgi:hypothetical protein